MSPAETNGSFSENKTAQAISPTKKAPTIPAHTEFHDNGYPPYNMAYPPNAYPYGGAVPPATGTYYYVPAPHSQSTSIHLIRGFIMCMILIIVAFFLAIFITWLIIRPEVPVFKVEAVSVSNFSTADSVLVANFDVKFSMENPNLRLKAYFDNFRQAIFYEDNIISASYSTPVELDKKQRKVINLKLSTNTGNHGSVGMSVVDDINKERAAGALKLNMIAVMSGSFRSGSSWTRKSNMRVVCEDLKMQFTGNSSDGTFNNGGKPRECSVYL